MRSLVQGASVRSKLFYSYFIIFIVPLFLIGTFSYIWIYNTVKSQTNRAYENTLGSSIKTVNQQLSSIESMALQLSNTNWIRDIMYMKGDNIDPERINSFELEYYRQQLQGWIISNDFVSDIAICFKEKDLVLSTMGKNDFNWFIEETFAVDKFNKEDWLNYTKNYVYSKLFSGLNVSTYQRIREGSVYLQSLPFSDSNSRALFVAFIEDKAFKNIFDILFVEFGTIMYIMNENNELVAGNIDNNDEILGIQKDLGNTEDYYGRSFKLSGNDYHVFRETSDINEWTYTLLVPRKIIMNQVDQIRNIFLGLFLCFLILGIAVSYLSALRHYQPLLNIMETIRVNVLNIEMTGSKNEYYWIEQNIKSLIRQEDTLSKKLDQQKPVLADTYLNKLINNKTNPEAIRVLELLDITFPFRYNICCILNNLNEEENQLFINTLNDTEDLRVYYIYGHNLVLLINYQEPEVYDKILTILDNLLDNTNKDSFAGIGNIYESIVDLSVSYDEALMALDYKLINEDNKIIIYDEIQNLKSSYYYPSDSEYIITSSLRSGSYDKAQNEFETLLTYNLSNEQISANALKLFLVNVKLTALKLIEEMSFEEYFDMTIDDVYHLNSIDVIKEGIRSVFRDFCILVNSGKKSENEELKHAIYEYIEENFKNDQLSLSMIASHFNLSGSYFCRFFKEQFGSNFLDYLNRKRIEYAKNKMKENEFIDITTLSQNAGYINTSTFRRLFKKYEGVPPSQYKV